MNMTVPERSREVAAVRSFRSMSICPRPRRRSASTRRITRTGHQDARRQHHLQPVQPRHPRLRVRGRPPSTTSSSTATPSSTTGWPRPIGAKRNILVGGDNWAENPQVLDNRTYFPAGVGGDNNVGYPRGRRRRGPGRTTSSGDDWPPGGRGLPRDDRGQHVPRVDPRARTRPAYPDNTYGGAGRIGPPPGRDGLVGVERVDDGQLGI